MSFKKFLTKYASEMLVIGDALGAVASNSNGDRSDLNKIRDAGDVAKSAAENIMETIDDVQDMIQMDIGREELVDIVQELLPLILREIMEQIVGKETFVDKIKKVDKVKDK